MCSEKQMLKVKLNDVQWKAEDCWRMQSLNACLRKWKYNQHSRGEIIEPIIKLVSICSCSQKFLIAALIESEVKIKLF